jgi:putative exporter of polyketide antibiotics
MRCSLLLHKREKRRWMDTVQHGQTKRMSVMWLAVTLALIAAASYLLIQFGLLGVGDLQPNQQPAAIVFIAAAGSGLLEP